MPLLWVALALAALLIGSCSSRPSALHESDALDVLVESELGLRQPITVTRIGMFRDGGSFGGALRDTNGKELLFALDRRERIVEAGADSVPNDGPPHPQHAYLGSDYPGTAHSRALQVGSRAESALIAVLRSFVDRILPSSAQQSVLSKDLPLGERLDKASSFGESGSTAAMALMIISQLETQRLPTSEEDLADLPQFSQWLAAWAPDSAGLSAASFCLAWSAPFQEFRYPDADTTTLAMQVREPGWVLSPDSSRGLHVAIPGDEPDSEVLMVELTTGRSTRVLYSGTPSDFELAWWIDTDTALVAGGDWDHLAPLLYRLDLADGRLDCFRGPELSPADGRHAKLEKAVRALWTQRFVPGK